MVTQYGFLPDIMATIVEATGATYPKEFNGNNIHTHSGKSLLPLLKGAEKEIHNEPIFWEHEGNKAVRLGDYKLVMKWTHNKTSEWELYNILTDRTEMHNLADSLPEKVLEMQEMYNQWATKTKVLPWNEVLKLYKTKD